MGGTTSWTFRCPYGETINVNENNVKHDILYGCSGAIEQHQGGCDFVENGWTDTDGCSIPEDLKDVLTWDEVFKPACDMHDICYQTPGVAKAPCDSEFLFN
eukprot:809640_1